MEGWKSNFFTADCSYLALQNNLRYLRVLEVNFMFEKIKRVTPSKNKVGIGQICKTLQGKCFIYFQNIMRKEYKRVWQGPRNPINLQRMQRNVIESFFVSMLFLVCYSVVCYFAAALVFEPYSKFSIVHRCKTELVSEVGRGDQDSHNYARIW